MAKKPEPAAAAQPAGDAGQHAWVLMVRRRMIWALAIILLVGALPLLYLLLAVAIALLSGFDKGSVHSYVMFGIDLGDVVSIMANSALIAMFAIPTAGVALVFWFVLVLILPFIHWRRQRQAPTTGNAF